MNEMLVTIYEVAAQFLYLLVAFIVAVFGFFFMANADHAQRLGGLLRDVPVLSVGAAVVVLQLAATCMAIGFYGDNRVDAIVVQTIMISWVTVLLALAIAPMGILLTREMRTIAPGASSKRWWIEVGGGTLFIIVFSYAYFIVLGQFISIEVTEFFETMIESSWALLAFMPMVLVAAVVEEVIFRMGLQSLLERACHKIGAPVFLAVAAASAVWAVGHAGMLGPVGIKEGQIFVVGLVLGVLKIRHGAAACIGGHLALNASALVAELLLDVELY